MKIGEVIYAINDLLKNHSDDSDFTLEHIKFFAEKYRATLIMQRYTDVKKFIPESNYQMICLDMIPVDAIPGLKCKGMYLRSVNKLPKTISLGNPTIYPFDAFDSKIMVVSQSRMKFAGSDRYTKKLMYATIGPDNYLYIKSSNPQMLYLRKVRMNAIFEDIITDPSLMCCTEENCDWLDIEFPMESALVSILVEGVTKQLIGYMFQPKDFTNNATDDSSNIQGQIQQPQQQQQ